jgi:LuxR family maltose regulon positive regulatory protein
LYCKLILISAPAGFGKTTLVSEWVQAMGGATLPTAIAWLSLDESDNDPTRFLAYFVAALQTIEARQEPVGLIGKGALSVLQSPQPPPAEAILTTLINEIATLPNRIVLVLDDYHVIDAKPVDSALAFLLEHLPPQMHLVIATREDPHLPLARLRSRGQLTELRAADLRFTLAEAAEFLNQVMGLDLSTEDIAALETRTEGWIAGLQLAAISIRGRDDAVSLIKSFTGSHRFVLDYLIEEVLDQQPQSVQNFLLQTAILNRLTGSLCDAVTGQENGQATLEMLDRANLFIIPLDNERCWYRYHHLFADLLRQRLQSPPPLSSPPEGEKEGGDVAELHIRASVWYEQNGLEIEAFQHAVAANDVERAARLMAGGGMPLHFRGAVIPVLNWLASLPKTVLDARPSLWVMYASALSMTGQTIGVEEKLQAAEAALQGAEFAATADGETRNIIGHIAAIRALLAAAQRQVETIISQSRRALEYLHPSNLPVRTATTWKLGIAYQLQGDRAAASQAYNEAIAISQASGNNIINIAASIGLGNVQETENQLQLAAQTYRRVLKLVGDQLMSAACLAHLGLARIFYEWNDLDAAQQHAQQCVQLASQIENVDKFVVKEVLLARLKLAQGDMAGAAAILDEADQFVYRRSFLDKMSELAAVQVLTLLCRGNLEAAADLAEKHKLPLVQVQVHLARGDTSSALAVLEPFRQQMEAKGWQDERLKALVLQAVTLQAHGEKDEALQVLGDALALAEPGGFVRIFVDQGSPMAALLQEAAKHGIAPNYVSQLRAAFGKAGVRTPITQLLVEPLSERELEVLELLGTELNGPEIARELVVSLNTMRTHTKNIYNKLGVNNRRAAVRRAEELDLL